MYKNLLYIVSYANPLHVLTWFYKFDIPIDTPNAYMVISICLYIILSNDVPTNIQILKYPNSIFTLLIIHQMVDTNLLS